MGKISFLSGAGNQTTLDGLSRAVTHIYKRNGVILSTDLAVTENDTPDTNVKIATGAIVIGFDGSYPEDAYYYGFADATELVAISANVSGNARIDAIVAYVDTANPGTTDNDGALVFTAVEGTPAGSPTAPSDNDIQTDLGAGVRWHRLANVAVANGFATIVNANITDTRDRTFIEAAKVGGTQTYTDTISEYTSGTGVTVDGLSIKDGKLNTANSVVNSNITDGAVTQSEAPTLIEGAGNNYKVIGDWSYYTGNGSAERNGSVSFGITFTARPFVVISGLGYKSGSNPSHIGDFPSQSASVWAAGAISTTGFTYRASNAQTDGARRDGFNWIAYGPV